MPEPVTITLRVLQKTTFLLPPVDNVPAINAVYNTHSRGILIAVYGFDDYMLD